MAILRIADIEFDPNKKIVKLNGKEIDLTPKESELLNLLIKNKNEVVSRKVILNKIWHYTSAIESRVADVYIGYLRKKLNKGKKKLIHSVRGFGYSIKG